MLRGMHRLMDAGCRSAMAYMSIKCHHQAQLQEEAQDMAGVTVPVHTASCELQKAP